MFRVVFLLCGACFLLFHTALFANPGEDGDHTISTSGVVVNAYTSLAASASRGAGQFTVDSVAALALPAAACSGCSLPLGPGDLLMLYQPQGAVMDSSVSLTDYGSITNYAASGLYEFVYVRSIATNTISFYRATPLTPDPPNEPLCSGLRNDYPVSINAGVSAPMVIRVPQYRNLTVNAGASIVAATWNGSTGGVVVLDVRDGPDHGVLQLNGAISATGRGFRGGTDITNQSDTSNSNSGDARYVPAAGRPSADKGESIVGSVARYNNLAGRAGRGAPANGGGGGSGHNGAGGGGSNAAAGAWNGGMGVPDLTGANDPGNGVGYTQAWCLDPQIGNGTTSCTIGAGAGGGRGGYTWGTLFAGNPFVNAPATSAWGSSDSNRRNLGGLGGRPLNAAAGSGQRGQAYARLFFGGGGGAGDANNSGGTNAGWAGSGCNGVATAPPQPPNVGGRGGGLVFVTARRIQGNGRLEADGSAGQSNCAVSAEGPGGGGGGGTVVAITHNTNAIPDTVALRALGGKGGDQLNADTSMGVNCAGTGSNCESQGGGGGGGGGVILRTAGGNATVAGGANGITNSPSLQGMSTGGPSRFYPNGATSGSVGTLGAAPNTTGADSPFACLQGPAFTTPVALAYLAVDRIDADQLRVRFGTESEVGNVGFMVIAEDADARLVDASQFVASQQGFSDQPLHYSLVIPAHGVQQVSLGDVDGHGKGRVFGPVRVGEMLGEVLAAQPYEWQPARDQLLQYRAAVRQASARVAKVGVAQTGLHRLSFEQLQAAGVELAGTPAGSIALWGRQGPLARRIEGGDVFGPGSALLFFAEARPSLWSRETYLMLGEDPQAVRDMAYQPLTGVPGPLATYQAHVVYDAVTGYQASSPTGSPWYAERMVATSAPVTRTITMQGPEPVSGEGVLELVLWGGLSWQGEEPDHSLRIAANGVELGVYRWSGITTKHLNIPLALHSGTLDISLTLLADTPYPSDVVFLQRAELRYQASAVGDGQLFVGSGLSVSEQDTLFSWGEQVRYIGGSVTVDGVAAAGLRAFRIDPAGVPEELHVAEQPDGVEHSLRSVYASLTAEDARLWVGTASDFVVPSVSAMPSPDLAMDEPAEWLAISHGVFLSALEPLRAARQAEGLSARVVDVESVFARHSGGNPDPQAIAEFVREAHDQLGTRYLLLVGADTLDAPGYLNSGSVSFVPTPYIGTNALVRYAPADALLGDINADGVPDIAVGRLPVRTLEEANVVVQKILAYATQPAQQRMLFAAGPQNGDPVSFTLASASFESLVPPSVQRSTVYQDQLGLQAARAQLVAGFNGGQSLISYIGHSGRTQWTFDPLFSINQVLGTHPNQGLNLAPTPNQPIVLQFACWTTYYVSATQNSLGQVLLNQPTRGASAIVGASVLMEQRSHELMAEALAPELLSGVRLGDAILAAKQAVSEVADANQLEIQAAQVLLGDPAQRIR